MKIVADSIPQADRILIELLEFEAIAKTLAAASAPYSISGEGRPLARFIAETSTELKKNAVQDFSVRFPSLQILVENGTGGLQSLNRLHDACFAFNKAQQFLHKSGYIVRDDNSREKVSEQFKTVVGDLVVFVCLQFGFANLAEGEVQLAVSKHCERCGMTADVFFGILKQELEDVERSWYAYEVISPMYAALNEFDPVFIGECEENNYPLSDAMAKEIIDGKLDVAVARGMLTEHMMASEEQDVNVTPSTLIEQMRLA